MRRINWIDIVKGISCMTVFTSHYILSFNKDLFFSDGQFKLRGLYFMVNGSFAVYMFLIISFFLTSRTLDFDEMTTKKMSILTINRYIRLSIPIVISSFFVFLIQGTCRFHNSSVGFLESNDWFSGFYNNHFTLKEIIISSFFGVLFGEYLSINSPLWVLEIIFKGFFISIVFTSVIKSLKNNILKYCVYIIIIIIFIYMRCIYYTVFLGGALSLIYDDIQKKNYSSIFYKSLVAILGILALFSVGFFPGIVSTLGKIIFFRRIITIELLYSLCAFLVLVACSFIFGIDDVKDNNIIAKFSLRSMGIYLFHWPIICSVSAYIYKNFFIYKGICFLVIHYFLTLLMVYFLADLYTIAIERTLIKKVISAIRYNLIDQE